MNKKTGTILIVCILLIAGIAILMIPKQKPQQSNVLDIPENQQETMTETSEAYRNKQATDSKGNSPTTLVGENTPTTTEQSKIPTQEPTETVGKPVEQIADKSNILGDLYPGDINANSINGGYSAVTKDYLFITEDFNDTDCHGKIVRINLSNGEKNVLVNSAGASLIVHEDWLYYANISEGGAINAGPIYRILKKGGDPELICTNDCTYLAIHGDYLIYYSFTDEKLYKKDLTIIDNDPECLISFKLRWINDSGDKIIFFDTNQRIILSMDINTKEVTELYRPGEIKNLILSGDILYYVKKVNEQWLLTLYDLKTKKEQTLIDDNVARFTLYKDKIVFTKILEGRSDRLESMLYLFNPEMKTISELGNGNIGSIYGSKMIYFREFENDSIARLTTMDLIPSE